MANARQLASAGGALRLQLAIITISVIVALVCVIFATNLIAEKADTSERQAKSSVLGSEGAAILSDIERLVNERVQIYLSSPAFAALSPRDRDLVRNELLRNDGGPSEPDIPAVEIPMPVNDAVRVQNSINHLRVSGGELLQTSQQEVALRVAPKMTSMLSALRMYFEKPTPSNVRGLRYQLNDMRQTVEEYRPDVLAETERNFGELGSTLAIVRLALIGALIAIGLTALVATYLMGRRVEAAWNASRRERETLAYRNTQLNALYAVFNEITDSLSLRYVVDATVRESKRLVGADTVVLRLVRQHELVVAGTLTDSGGQVEGIETVQMGEGLTGRVARRGKTMRLDEDVGNASNYNWAQGMESVVIVPLIVGARVVGTLACWSRRRFAFSEDDQRVLEMMASQVATAVVAADSTEVNQRRAQLDPLTSLPNRRELDQDIQGFLAEVAESGRPYVVAMADIDHFKRFNDTFGHKVGDITLQKVAAVLRSSMRESDRIYRYGGEEFAIVFVDSDRQQGIILAERIRSAVESTPLTGDELEPVGPVTISLGLALSPEHARDFSVLLQLADEAMYKSKQAGRNRVTLWSPSTARQPLVA